MGLLNIDLLLSDRHISSAANISATKIQQQYVFRYSQPNAAATTETRALHVAYGATGSTVVFRAGSIVANIGAATVTLDLRKNGTTVLTGVITLDSSNTARITEDAVLASTAYVAGDWFDVVITATAGGGTLATGVFCELVVRETPA